MMADAPRVHLYRASGRSEFMLAYGPEIGPQILVFQPLFEEMNRCRALVAALCRGLAERGIGCWLPDLPGTGESLRALETVAWSDWLDAARASGDVVRDASGSTPHSIAIRGGTLLDAVHHGRRWRLSPTGGRSLLSDLRRSALAGGGDPSAPAGYRLHAALTGPLEAADVAADDTARTLRLVSDDRPADRYIDAPPLWRRPEPTYDAEMAAVLIDDIADWTKA